MKKEWFYIPNIIGYVRICLLLLFFIAVDPLAKVLFMTSNLILDVFDGKAARFFNQCSLFGARLDLIIDMFSLTLLSFYVAFLVNNFWLSTLFVICGMNDLLSYALSINIFYGKKAEQKINHKQEIGKKGFLLPSYYSVWGLALGNVLHDAYLLKFVFWPPILDFAIPFLLVGFVFRQCAVAEQTFHLWSRSALWKSKS